MALDITEYKDVKKRDRMFILWNVIAAMLALFLAMDILLFVTADLISTRHSPYPYILMVAGYAAFFYMIIKMDKMFFTTKSKQPKIG